MVNTKNKRPSTKDVTGKTEKEILVILLQLTSNKNINDGFVNSSQLAEKALEVYPKLKDVYKKGKALENLKEKFSAHILADKNLKENEFYSDGTFIRKHFKGYDNKHKVWFKLVN